MACRNGAVRAMRHLLRTRRLMQDSTRLCRCPGRWRGEMTPGRSPWGRPATVGALTSRWPRRWPAVWRAPQRTACTRRGSGRRHSGRTVWSPQPGDALPLRSSRLSRLASARSHLASLDGGADRSAASSTPHGTRIGRSVGCSSARFPDHPEPTVTWNVHADGHGRRSRHRGPRGPLRRAL